MAGNEDTIGRINNYLRQLSPQARGRLLAEIERLHVCGEDIPGGDAILAGLRAELRDKGQSHDRGGNASRYFFQPLEPVLVERSPEHANSGQISRGSLAAIWAWIGQTVLPTMMRDYNVAMKNAIGANNVREAQQLAATFQTKVIKYLENNLRSPDGIERIRTGLSMYTSSRATFDDLTKMVIVLRTGAMLAKFKAALPPQINKLKDDKLADLRRLINALAAKHQEALPFTLTIAARHLKRPRELINLAVRVPERKRAKDGSTTPIPLAVSMVVDQLDDKRLMLGLALRANRIPAAKEFLAEIDDIEQMLRDHADLLVECNCGHRLDELMNTVANLVDSEVQSIPGEVTHILGTRRHRRGSLVRQMKGLLSKGRSLLSGGAADDLIKPEELVKPKG